MYTVHFDLRSKKKKKKKALLRSRWTRIPAVLACVVIVYVHIHAYFLISDGTLLDN